MVPIITLDGPSGTGKGTICQMLAKHLNWNVLDSGCIYRALALAAKKNHTNLQNEFVLAELARGLDLQFVINTQYNTKVLLDGQDVTQEIRSEQCGQNASQIAILPEVRKALLNRQRAFAIPPGLVTDGRDMGTVVFPNAILKIFLYASPEERAIRRHLQLKEKGIDVSLCKVVNELTQRDSRDSSRIHAPLQPSADSFFIDTTGLTIVQVFNNVLKFVKEHLVCE